MLARLPPARQCSQHEGDAQQIGLDAWLISDDTRPSLKSLGSDMIQDAFRMVSGSHF
jgi:hypothetical protein